MGSGKSLIGKRLAEALGWKFVDLDLHLEKSEGRSISEIFTQDGEMAFRLIEARCLRSCTDLENSVVATGGGAPCFHANMAWMNDNGLTVYLDVPDTVLALRLENEVNERPLLAGKTGQALLDFIKIKLETRQLFYGKAQFVCHAASPIDEIIASLGGYFNRFIK